MSEWGIGICGQAAANEPFGTERIRDCNVTLLLFAARIGSYLFVPWNDAADVPATAVALETVIYEFRWEKSEALEAKAAPILLV
ncbi:hypothetical protein Cob_v000854 [Colletotrichum orbiculare MAFF 240422]|uniref:Uncharacterized protein n=1 Tax=Colletotrichum orbiculare (strain 104-T / ATCC 96160 / CBS 514.97 / LARS 414 / MAFF 240422) TaxID=1213857 RepID=A0A484G6D8_COLOR|nr:hypothetical protein Cob_v000854 [Colletotrichum orbiculare MAFF 240422]